MSNSLSKETGKVEEQVFSEEVQIGKGNDLNVRLLTFRLKVSLKQVALILTLRSFSEARTLENERTVLPGFWFDSSSEVEL